LGNARTFQGDSGLKTGLQTGLRKEERQEPKYAAELEKALAGRACRKMKILQI
jgi:hypothetical protein